MSHEIEVVPVAGQTRNDAAGKPFWSPKREKASKCLLFLLIAIVFAAAALLILALIFFPAKTPAVKILSVTVTDTRYDGKASFNASLQAHLSIKNPNFGEFRYETGTGRFYDAGSVVGEMNIPAGRVGPRKREHVDVTVMLTSLRSGLLEVRSRLTVSGRIYLLDSKVMRVTNPEMNCLIPLNLTAPHRQVQHFSCE